MGLNILTSVRYEILPTSCWNDSWENVVESAESHSHRNITRLPWISRLEPNLTNMFRKVSRLTVQNVSRDKYRGRGIVRKGRRSHHKVRKPQTKNRMLDEGSAVQQKPVRYEQARFSLAVGDGRSSLCRLVICQATRKVVCDMGLFCAERCLFCVVVWDGNGPWNSKLYWHGPAIILEKLL